MSRGWCSLVLATCVVTCAVFPEAGRAQAPELKKLFVVMAFDTNDEGLRVSLEKDEKTMLSLLRAAIPTSRYEVVKTLKGDAVTKTNLLAAVKSLKKKVSPNDSVLFFYGGHGALTKNGHVLKMTVEPGKDVLRSDLRKELEGLGAGLAVLLTDCCSTKERSEEPVEGGVIGRASDGVQPTVRHLFFQARGVVDVTAATEEEAWSDDKNGGLFTRSLARMLLKKLPEVDSNKDGTLTWKEFFPQLQTDTQRFFKTWSKAMMARYPDARIRSETQKPHAFYLGSQTAYAAVEIQNIKPTPLVYKFRWEGSQDWISFELKPGEKRTHALPAEQGVKAEELPWLEIHRDGAPKPDGLEPVLWVKDRAPKNLPKLYRIKK